MSKLSYTWLYCRKSIPLWFARLRLGAARQTPGKAVSALALWSLCLAVAAFLCWCIIRHHLALFLVLIPLACLSVFLRQKSQDAAARKRKWQIADAMPAIVWTRDANGETDYMNSQWRQVTGLTAEQGRTDAWRIVLHPDDYDLVIANRKEAARLRLPYEGEYRLRTWDGTYRWFLGRGVPVIGANRKVSFWVGTATDIDDQKRASEQKSAFLNHVLMAITGDKLVLVGRQAELPALSKKSTLAFPLTDTGSVSHARAELRCFCRNHQFSREAEDSAATSAEEAMNNAVRYGGGGTVRFCLAYGSAGMGAGGEGQGQDSDPMVRVWVEDKGGGIPLANLPGAVPEESSSTKGMGYGFRLMQSYACKVHLYTSPEGTTVVLCTRKDPKEDGVFTPFCGSVRAT